MLEKLGQASNNTRGMEVGVHRLCPKSTLCSADPV